MYRFSVWDQMTFPIRGVVQVADTVRAAEYEVGPYKGFADEVLKGFSSIVPPDADVSAVAEAIVRS